METLKKYNRQRQIKPPDVGSNAWLASFTDRGYDHIHWSRVKAEPLDKDMGTLSGEVEHPTGSVVLLGRYHTGYHHFLYGPITAEEYKRIQKE
jgi:hypothetical protein